MMKKQPSRLRVVIEVFSQEYRRRVSSGAFFASTLLGMLVVILLSALPSLAPALEKTGILATPRLPVTLTGPIAIIKRAAPLINADHLMQIVGVRETEPRDLTPQDDLKKTGAQADLRFELHSNQNISKTAKTLNVYITTENLHGDWRGRLRPLLPLSASYETGSSIAAESRIIKVPYYLASSTPHDSMNATAKSGEEAIASLLLGALYGSILVGSQMLMGGISEEKTNRVAEMLSAMGNPRDLLSGKVISAASLAITQGAVWVVGGVVTYYFTSRSMLDEIAKNAVTSPTSAHLLPPIQATITTFAVFLVVGPLTYLQFAGIYAGSASLVSRPEEVSMLSAPLALPVAGAALSGLWAAPHPDSTFAHVASFVPLIGGFTLTARVGSGTYDTTEVILVLLVQLLYTLLFLESAARIYRVGLTLYGRFPSLRQILTMLQKA